jgi:hypothetical protein
MHQRFDWRNSVEYQPQKFFAFQDIIWQSFRRYGSGDTFDGRS